MMASSTGFLDLMNPWSWSRRRVSGSEDSFSEALKLYPDLWRELFSGTNIICCPVPGSLKDDITKDQLMSHILIPQRGGGEYLTVRGEQVVLSGSQLVCGAGFPEQREVKVISASEIVDADGSVATIFRISRPLVGGILAPDDSDEISLQTMFKYMAVLRSFPEAESSFIVLDDYIEEINFVGSKAPDGFSRIQPSLCASLQLQWERATEKLCRISTLVAALGSGPEATKRLIGQILESYLMHSVSATVYPWVGSSRAEEDKLLYEYLETLQYHTQSDLGIPPALQCCQVEAVRELHNLRFAGTPVDKLLVLKRAVRHIRSRVDRNVARKYPADDVELATDDIVLLIIWALLQLQLSQFLPQEGRRNKHLERSSASGQRTFLSDLVFASKYHFNESSKSELGFTLCHFEVALDWFTSRTGAFGERKKVKAVYSVPLSVPVYSVAVAGCEGCVMGAEGGAVEGLNASIGPGSLDGLGLGLVAEGEPVPAYPDSKYAAEEDTDPGPSHVESPKAATGGFEIIEGESAGEGEHRMGNGESSIGTEKTAGDELLKAKEKERMKEIEKDREKEIENELFETDMLGLEYLRGVCITAAEMNLYWIATISKNQRHLGQRGTDSPSSPFSDSVQSTPMGGGMTPHRDIPPSSPHTPSSPYTPSTPTTPARSTKAKTILLINRDNLRHPEQRPSGVTIVSERSNRPGEILGVSGAAGVFAAVNIDGKAFTWGVPDSGRLGRGPAVELDCFSPTPLPLSVDGGGLSSCKVTQVACGKVHMVAVTEEGEVYAWGDNRCAQLGVTVPSSSSSFPPSSSSSLSYASQSTTAPSTPLPRPPTPGVPPSTPQSRPAASSSSSSSSSSSLLNSPYVYLSFAQIASSRMHLPSPLPPTAPPAAPLSGAVRTELSAVMACGPVVVDGMRGVHVTAVACGAHHTLCLSDEGQIYSWGRGANGRLGQFYDRISIPDYAIGRPTAVRSHRNWEAQDFELIPSSYTTHADSASMDILDHGYTELGVPMVAEYDNYFTSSVPNGTLDPDSLRSASGATIRISTPQHRARVQSFRVTGPTVTLPTTPSFLNRVVCISAGFAHSLAVTASGGVFSWGCGSNGRLGHGSHCDEHKPRQVQVLTMSAIHVTSLSAGAAHSMFLSDSGLLFGCGLNSSGQVGVASAGSEEGEKARDRHDRWSILCPLPVNVTARAHSTDSSEVGHIGGDTGAADISLPVSQVSCGDLHTAITTHTGRLLIWGDCTQGPSSSLGPKVDATPCLSGPPLKIGCAGSVTMVII